MTRFEDCNTYKFKGAVQKFFKNLNSLRLGVKWRVFNFLFNKAIFSGNQQFKSTTNSSNPIYFPIENEWVTKHTSKAQPNHHKSKDSNFWGYQQFFLVSSCRMRLPKTPVSQFPSHFYLDMFNSQRLQLPNYDQLTISTWTSSTLRSKLLPRSLSRLWTYSGFSWWYRRLKQNKLCW